MAEGFVIAGVRHHQAGRLDEAAKCYAQVVPSDPEWPHALHYLGLISLQKGDYRQAAALIRQAIERSPSVAEFHVNLGNAEKRLGNFRAAIASYDQAIVLRPRFAEAQANRGLAMIECGMAAEAITALEQAIEANPQLDSLRLPLARLYFSVGNFSTALAMFSALSAELLPADAQVEAGIAALELRQPELACQFFTLALPSEKTSYDALNGLGAALADLGQISKSIETLAAARKLDPTRLPAVENLANTLKDAGRIDEALALYREGLLLEGVSRSIRSNYLLTTLYSDRLAEPEVFAAHEHFGPIVTADVAPLPPPATRGATERRRVRIAYVSADFFDHPVAHFLVGILRNHDCQRFHVFAYHTGSFVDAWTERLKSRTEVWRDASLLDDARLVELIRSDEIDVAIDLSGHTGNHRLSAFATRVAPVQLSYLGYPFATGIRQIDSRIVDNFTDPENTETTESLIRLPRSCFAYTPPEVSPDVLPLPLLANGNLTLGVASNLAKVTASTLDDWASLLVAFPGTALRWRAKAFSDLAVRQQMADALVRRGVAGSNILLEGWVPNQARWEALSAVDVALDTRPYNQATSTCEAMWMGVPTLTIAGGTHRSRVGASILAAAGLHECIGKSPADWVRLIGRWIDHPEALAKLRETMRPRMLASELCNCAGLARELERAYAAAAQAVVVR